MIGKTGYNPDAIKDGLYKLKDYPGVSGKTNFDRNGDVIKSVMFKTVKNKQFVPIKE